MKIFITGNVGSGKSTFLKLLRTYVDHHHYEFLDLDAIAKKIIADHNISLPENRNAVFEDANLLYSVEDKIIPLIASYMPLTEKVLIMEASTLIECPLILSKNDIVIHVSSPNHMEQTFSRDKVENRAALISRAQVSPWIKSVISDINILNDSTLEDLEQKAKRMAANLNHQCTPKFFVEQSKLTDLWNENFSSVPWIKTILKKYSSPERNMFNLAYLGHIFDNLPRPTKLSPLWDKALKMAIFFHHYNADDGHSQNENIDAIWNMARNDDALDKLVIGSRSYISLACELLYSLGSDEKYSHSLNYGEGKVARELLHSLPLVEVNLIKA